MPKKELDATVEALVGDQLLADEMILDWEESGGEIRVRLINKKLHEMCAPIARRFGGKGSGKGRSVEFRLVDGQWEFVGLGGWIS
jgi:hypothetical protein